MLRKPFRKSKKAQGLTEAFSWILAVFETMLFFVLFSLPGCDSIPEQALGSVMLTNLKLNYDFNAFLRTPIEYQGAELTIADMIVLSEENESLKKIWVSTIPFVNIRILDSYDAELAKKFQEIKDTPLTAATKTMMDTYNIYFGEMSKKSLCLIRIGIASEDDFFSKAFFGLRLPLYFQKDCATRIKLAEAVLPSPSGENIIVTFEGTFFGPGMVKGFYK